ncbi:hypothetical protein SCLCIDRAFT_275637 [Scleroderma citrinum Foug A]|uniref:Uncharacterized protein n=1 Tax=Scleroderma citrinum Foug A TaxID=1036808 RepID=A0A0C2ZTM7_9AGAM|nr:hypothetical protein SCLCIDRAFT_275637 [Scleroderma citrinum Foug A]
MANFSQCFETGSNATIILVESFPSALVHRLYLQIPYYLCGLVRLCIYYAVFILRSTRSSTQIGSTIR